LARIRQARAIPQPVIGYDSDLQPDFFGFTDSGESYFGVSQSIEFPLKTITRGRIATAESDELLADTDLLKLDLAFRVKEAFYGLLLAQEMVGYAESDLYLAQDFLQKTELKLEAGDVAKVEVLRAQVEASRAMNAARSATNEVRVSKAVVNFYLARRESAPLEIEGELRTPRIDFDLEAFRRAALAHRPELRRIASSLEKGSLAKRQAYLSYAPDLDLSVSRHRLEGEPTTWDVTFALPVPLYFWQPRGGEIAEARANIEALQREQEHLRNVVALEVEEAHADALRAANQIELFESEILNQAEEVYNMFLFSYQEGEIGGIQLIEARRTLMEARRAYAEALYGYAVAIASLQRAIGQGE